MRLALLSIALAGALVAAKTDNPALAAFEERLDNYVKLRKELADKLPPLKKKSDPEEIRARDEGLAAALKKARAGAKQGDILSEDVRPIFAQLLKNAFSGPSKQDVKAAVKEGNPKNEKAPGEVEPVVAVNAVYPTNSPLSTVPPAVLLRLPKLPKDIEYRFVGRTLILRDRLSNLIIDYMKGAVPAV